MRRKWIVKPKHTNPNIGIELCLNKLKYVDQTIKNDCLHITLNVKTYFRGASNSRNMIKYLNVDRVKEEIVKLQLLNLTFIDNCPDLWQIDFSQFYRSVLCSALKLVVSMSKVPAPTPIYYTSLETALLPPSFDAKLWKRTHPAIPYENSLF